MKTPVLRVRVTCVRARKSFGKMEVERQTMLHQSVKVVLGRIISKKGDANRVGQALCFLLLLSNLSDSQNIYILDGIESLSLKIVGIQNRFCSFSLIFHSFPYYLPLYICRAVEHRMQHNSVIRVWTQKMGYHCIPTLLTLNLIL